MSKQYPGGIVSKTPVVPTSLSAPGIWTLNQQAAAQATNTWPFPRDPQFKNVTMLLHGDGSAGGVAATGVGAGVSTTVTNFNADASTNNFNVTINGDARSDNLNPYQAGYYSNYFAGTSGQYLNAPANAAFSFGTGDFTVEGWVYPTTTSGTRPIVEIRTTGGATGFAFLSQSGASTLNVYTNSAFVGASTNSLTLNAWSHVALVRSGNTWAYWINGVASGSFTNSSTQSDGATTGPKIGGSTSAGEVWVGYLSNIRIIKGTAVYTSAFTPSTTPLTAISGTSLLTCQSNRFIDTSSNAFTITVNGSPQVSPAQPFTLPSSVATYGSGYFDGTGDYLSLTPTSALNLSTNSWTIEMWVNLTTVSANQVFINFGYEGSTQRSFVFYLTSANVLQFAYSTNGSNNTDTSLGASGITTGTWNHLAVVRNSTTITVYRNGVAYGTTITIGASAINYTPGAFRIGLDSSNYINGYMTDCRLVNGTAVYTSAFTPPTTPLTAITNTSLLTTQFNGGGNNSGFKDSSQFNFPITRNGNTTQGTFTPYSVDWSNYLNGSSNFTAGTTASNFLCTGSATGITATFEAWVYPTAYSTGGSSYLYSGIHTKGTTFFNFGIRDGAVRFYWYDGAEKNVTSASTSDVPLNTWTHIALTISGSTIKIYINGVLNTTSATYTGVQSAGSGNIEYIGKENNGYYVNGYVSNYRLTNTVVYSAAFTPSTTPLTAVTGTQLLTCQSNRFIDNSSNAFTVTAVSAPSVQGFSPFAPLTVYNPTTYGGSAYFDGTGDYLTELTATTALNLSSGDWSISFWVYKTATANGSIVNLYNSAGNTSGLSIWIGSGGVKVDNGVSGGVQAGTVAVNAWSYIEVIRASGTTTIYVNGVSAGTTTQTPNASQFGSFGSAADGTLPHQGYITDLRIVKGTALISSVPTAPLTAITNTSLLLNYTNPAILDNSMLNNLETVGNAAVSTSVKKYGAASMYFDGNGDNLFAPSSPNMSLSSGDWTLEAWVYVNSLSANQTIICVHGGSFGINWFINTSGQLVVDDGQTGQSAFTSASISATTWTHVALTRSSTTTRGFVNGVLAGSNTFTPQTCSILLVGRFTSGATPQYFNGYIDELRITKGVARYTANFTVPDQAFPNG